MDAPRTTSSSIPLPGSGKGSSFSQLISEICGPTPDTGRTRSIGEFGTLNGSPESRPVAAFYCATFLKPEMLHIYRQITALRSVEKIVITQKRENLDKFPFDKIDIVERPALHFLRRFWFRQIWNKPWQISRGELAAISGILNRE